MFVKLPARLVDRLIRAATSGCWSHDLLDADVGSVAVGSRHAATYVALSDHAHQLEVVRILDHGRAAAT
jgi:hypothetical protein